MKDLVTGTKSIFVPDIGEILLQNTLDANRNNTEIPVGKVNIKNLHFENK
jgi:hypothetical protein